MTGRRLGWAALCAVALCAATAAAKDWNAALDRGEILVYERPLPGTRAAGAELKAVIDAPPERVWAIIERCQNYVRTMPRVLKSQELSRKGGDVVCKVTVDMPFPYSDLTATTRVRHVVKPGSWRRSWRLIKGDYKVNRGSWLLRPFRGNPRRTLVRYRAAVLPNAWVPDWVRKMAQKRTMPKMIRRLRAVLARSGAG